MIRSVAAILTCTLLGACLQATEGTPSAIAAAPSEETASVAEPADPGEVEPKRGLLAGLFGGAKPEQATPAFPAPVAHKPDAAPSLDAAGSQKPERKGFFLFVKRDRQEVEKTVPTIVTAETEVVKAEPEAQAEAAPKPRKGFFLFRKAQKANPIGSEPEVAKADPEPVKHTAKPDTAALSAVDLPVPRQAGLFSIFRRAPKKRGQAEAVLASADAADAATSAPEQKPRKRRKIKGPEQRDVPYGTKVPFGEVVRVCNVPKRKLGKVVHKASGYVIRDSNPRSIDPHTFYLTGFADGCVRQLTAALVMFGSASMHEMIRYGLPAETQPYSKTDKSYEKVKRSVCGVGKRKPCGSKVKMIEKNTVFVSYYNNFKSNRVWANVLLHDGWVVAVDSKKGKKG